jgi:hypothetical protein
VGRGDLINDVPLSTSAESAYVQVQEQILAISPYARSSTS